MTVLIHTIPKGVGGRGAEDGVRCKSVAKPARHLVIQIFQCL